jgi:[ribosomal protein S5]-alanine N-acetyltransferase
VPDLILKTERLLLRPISEDDADILWPYVSNPEISKDMSWEAHKSISDTRAFIDGTLANMKAGKTITWCIYFEEKFCGVFSLISILRTHRALTYDRAELAYWLGPEFQGKGIMTEAGKKVIEYGFSVLKLNKIVVGHHVNNKNSENLILRLGFKFLYEEQEVFKKNNEWITCKFYELRAKEYLNK